jgi:hypothetical protein
LVVNVRDREQALIALRVVPPGAVLHFGLQPCGDHLFIVVLVPKRILDAAAIVSVLSPHLASRAERRPTAREIAHGKDILGLDDDNSTTRLLMFDLINMLDRAAVAN